MNTAYVEQEEQYSARSASRFFPPEVSSPSYSSSWRPEPIRVQNDSTRWWQFQNLSQHFFGDNEEDSESCFSLTWSERLYGFTICFIAGMLVSFMSFGSFSQIFLGNPAKFAVAYSIGNILSLCATGFLVGPLRQLSTMFDTKRIFATLLYLVCLVMTLVSVYTLRSGLFVIVFVVLQWGALIWYSLSYIPYGQDLATRIITSVIV